MADRKTDRKKRPAQRVDLAAFQLRGAGQQYRECPDPFLPWLAWRA